MKINIKYKISFIIIFLSGLLFYLYSYIYNEDKFTFIAENEVFSISVKKSSYVDYNNGNGKGNFTQLLSQMTKKQTKNVEFWYWYIAHDECENKQGRIYSINIENVGKSDPGTYSFIIGADGIPSTIATELCKYNNRGPSFLSILFN